MVKKKYYSYYVAGEYEKEPFGVSLKAETIKDVINSIFDGWAIPNGDFTLIVKPISYNEARKITADRKKERKDFAKQTVTTTAPKKHYSFHIIEDSECGNESFGVNLKAATIKEVINSVIDGWTVPNSGFTLEIKPVSHDEAQKIVADREKERKDFVKQNYENWKKRGCPSE